MRRVIAGADGINVVRSYCENMTGSAIEQAYDSGSQIRINHLERRANVEDDFFGPLVRHAPDHSNPVEIPRGNINDEEYYQEIIDLNPNLLVAYGCSLVEDPLLSTYEGRFLNLHLGLSPYYRGTGTNFWPLVNDEPEYVGATFMHINAGVDTGDIIHQIRARVNEGDGPHQIGSRIISDAAKVYPEIIRRFNKLPDIDHPANIGNEEAKYYRSSDYSESATVQLYENFESGLVEEYLAEMDKRTDAVPILRNPAITTYEE
jgi:methionyl-tRNA formyltransferase